ncbi:hypothetical protein BC938DRAFT_477840 [Jimgerdemannia flammicorona]|uniref:Uncharacterized protein n=1 Tax=Jimgerdemannia flammicorona TaxID=994334 RepID=A0A433P7H3_9FUNG|nr:hypothetical protein BC938DRAFT_477840 [Jimgerdemannia flammicorona]
MNCDEDALAASRSLEEELLGAGQTLGASLSSSLAAELHSVYTPPKKPIHPRVKLGRSFSSRQSNRSAGSRTDSIDEEDESSARSLFEGDDNNSSVMEEEVDDEPADKVNGHHQNGYYDDDDMPMGRNGLPIGVSRALADVDEMLSSASSPGPSPVPWASHLNHSYQRSRRSSYASSWGTADDDDDPFEGLKRQLEDVNNTVWETKALHKRLINSLLADESLQLSRGPTSQPSLLSALANSNLSSTNIRSSSPTPSFTSSQQPSSLASFTSSYSPPLELVVTSVVNLLERRARDRDRHLTMLRSIDKSLRTEAAWLTPEVLEDVDKSLAALSAMLTDPAQQFVDPLPTMRSLRADTLLMTDSLEELKEHMYVNKKQSQELGSRLRIIAKTVHEIRRDVHATNKYLAESSDEDAVILERGEVQERIKQIMWGLDDLDEKSSKEIRRMSEFWGVAEREAGGS